MIKKLPKFVTNLNIPQFNQIDRTSENISDPVIKAIVKYRTHPSIIAIKENCASKSNFNFSFVDKVDILNEIKMLQSNKATQNTDIPTKLIKDNADIFAEFIFISLDKCIEQSVFPSKLANITPVHKKIQKAQKKITDLLVFCQIFLKCMRSSCFNKCLNILNLFHRNISVDSGRDTVSNIVYHQC